MFLTDKYSFRSGFGHKNDMAVTVNTEHYKNIIIDLLWKKFDDFDLDDIRLKQYIAACHT